MNNDLLSSREVSAFGGRHAEEKGQSECVVWVWLKINFQAAKSTYAQAVSKTRRGRAQRGCEVWVCEIYLIRNKAFLLRIVSAAAAVQPAWKAQRMIYVFSYWSLVFGVMVI